MRRRRFTRCVLRSEAAITSGALDDARSALEEARQLIPDASEIVVLDGRMAESRDGLASSTVPVASALSLTFEEEDDDTPTSDAFDPLTTDASQATPAAMRLDRGRALFLTGWPIAVVPLALAGVLGIGVGQIAEPRSSEVEPPAALVNASIVTTPRVLTDAVASIAAVATSGTTTPQRRDSRLRASSFDSPGATVRDNEQIRAVLKRYERAYNRINDKAASASSPGAESGALEPTYEALPLRRISLGVCDITMSGETGVARCAGKAASDPKIGGTEAALRYWAFDLRKDADGWRIEQLKVE